MTVSKQLIMKYMYFQQMRRIIDGIGVEMTPEIFNTIWDVASTTSPQGLVSLPD